MFAALLVVSIAVFFWAPAIHFSGTQWPLYEALRTTAAIIFAVVGAWIAIAFPERLRLMPGGVDSRAGVSERFLDLFEPVVHSTVTLCVILLIGVVAPIAKGMNFSPPTMAILSRASFALLVLLTLWQVWTVVLTLRPADMLKSAMDQDVSAARSRDALRGLGSVEQPEKDDADTF